jgi:SAM-dependent methyltransferase
MVDDTWAALADAYADGAYATAKGRVRTYVLHEQLLAHLPPAPASVLDVGGGAGHQSFPLAALGYDLTLLEPSAAMLEKARERLARLAPDVQSRVTFVEAPGEEAAARLGRQFDVVLCHGVLGYQEDSEPLVDQLCRCLVRGGLVSIMAGNANASVVRPALERRWADALAAFDATTEIGVLGVPTWPQRVDDVSALLRARGVVPLDWYGVWLFADWLEFSGAPIDPADEAQIAAAARVELEASRRDPYRALSRVFHLVGRRDPRIRGATPR